MARLTDEQKHENRIKRFIKTLQGKDSALASETMAKGKAINSVAVDFQKLVRYREVDKNGYIWCVTCPNKSHWKAAKCFGDKGMDAGHFKAGRLNSTLFLDINCHPQCVSCNRDGSGNQSEYRRWMILTYGEEAVAKLEFTHNKEIKKFTYRELAEMKAKYLDEIAIELKRIENQEPPKGGLKTLMDYENEDVKF